MLTKQFYLVNPFTITIHNRFQLIGSLHRQSRGSNILVQYQIVTQLLCLVYNYKDSVAIRLRVLYGATSPLHNYTEYSVTQQTELDNTLNVGEIDTQPNCLRSKQDPNSGVQLLELTYNSSLSPAACPTIVCSYYIVYLSRYKPARPFGLDKYS